MTQADLKDRPERGVQPTRKRKKERFDRLLLDYQIIKNIYKNSLFYFFKRVYKIYKFDYFILKTFNRKAFNA